MKEVINLSVFFPLDPSFIAFLTSHYKKSKDESTGAETSVHEGKRDYRHDDSVSCATGEESGHTDKHVHFSEDVEIIAQENGHETIAEKQSGGSITIGDLQVSNNWLHMDSVETEKLEWMKDCPAPSTVDSKVLNNYHWSFST